MPNYVILPGLMGTELVADRYLIKESVWLNYAALAADGVPLMKLNVAGDGPAPLLPLKSWEVGRPLGEYYSSLISSIMLLGPTLVFGYDWRMSILPTARRLATMIEDVFPAGQVVIIAHSLGGLVARAAMAYMKADGHDSLTYKCITLGTPHYGCFAPLTSFARFNPTYLRLLALLGVVRGFSPILSAPLIDDSFSSFPSVYEVMPFTTVGPLAANPQLGTALYQSGTYALFNTYVRQARLTSALATQAFLATAGDPARTSVFMGTDVTTPGGIASLAQIGLPTGFSYTSSGDGTVSQDYGLWAGAGVLYFHGVEHSAMCNNASVLNSLAMVAR